MSVSVSLAQGSIWDVMSAASLKLKHSKDNTVSSMMTSDCFNVV